MVRYIMRESIEPSGYKDTRLGKHVLNSLMRPGWSGYRTAKKTTCPITALSGPSQPCRGRRSVRQSARGGPDEAFKKSSQGHLCCLNYNSTVGRWIGGRAELKPESLGPTHRRA